MARVAGVAEKALLLENNGSGQSAMPTLLVGPDKLAVLTSPLALKILASLGRKPQCPMDVARELGEHEQNMYYHFGKLARAGLVKEVKREKRQGMTAHIYQLAAPALTAKLSEADGEAMEVSGIIDPAVSEFFEPFVSKGKLNALVIMGDTYSHGQYDMYATEGVHAFDLGVLLGRALVAPEYPIHRFDTETNPHDLRESHAILIGHPQTNVFVEKVNAELPVYFEEQDDWSLVSRASGVKYRDPRDGIIARVKSPFNPEKRILVLAGRTRGTRATVLALTKFLPQLIEHIKNADTFCVVVKGFDHDSDGVIDAVKFME